MASVEVLPWGEGNSVGSVAAPTSDGGELQQVITGEGDQQYQEISVRYNEKRIFLA